MTGTMQNFRDGLRALLKNPGFTVIVIGTLALGIGANTAIFTLVNAVMLKNLPVANPNQLYRVGTANNCCVQSDLQNNWGLFSYSLYEQFRDHTPQFEELAAFQAGEAQISIRRKAVNEPARPFYGEFVSGNYFSMFGLKAFAGRTIVSSDDNPSSTPIAMISYRIWQQYYGHDASIVGSAVTINGVPFVIAGIAPPGFFGDTVRDDPPDVWMPLATEPAIKGENSILHQPGLNWLYIIGRLASPAQASSLPAQLTVELQQSLNNDGVLSDEERKNLSRQMVRLAPAGGGVAAMQQDYLRGVRLLMAVSGLVLLIACANIANLLLARGRALRQQVSVRLAFGSSRPRLIYQRMTESVMLAVLGGFAGLIVAYAGARIIVQLAFQGAKYVPIDPSPSLPVMAFAFVLSLLTGVVFGIIPAWTASLSDPIEAMRGANRGTERQSGLPQESLVVLQVAISIVLLVGAALLTQSLMNLQRQRLGFETKGRWIVNFDPALAGYTPERLEGLYRQLEQQLNQIPGVRSASFSTYSPMSGDEWGNEVYMQGRPAPAQGEDVHGTWDRVSPRYFETIGTPLLRGRTITDQDTPASRHVAVVNQAFVKKFFRSGADPIGQHFGLSGPEKSDSYEIVGVVADAKYKYPSAPPAAMFFLPLLQLTKYADRRFASGDVSSNYVHDIEIDMPGHVTGLEAEVQQVLANIDPNLTVVDMRSFEEQVGLNLNQERMVARLTSLSGILALILASIGLYGVTAYSVARRTSEIGIRMALGAGKSNVIATVLRDVGLQMTLGFMIGIPMALAAGKFLSSQLYGVKSHDLAAFVAAVALLGTCAIAGFVPARRATKVDPMVALRYE